LTSAIVSAPYTDKITINANYGTPSLNSSPVHIKMVAKMYWMVWFNEFAGWLDTNFSKISIEIFNRKILNKVKNTFVLLTYWKDIVGDGAVK
jgi:hypothetical protein